VRRFLFPIEAGQVLHFARAIGDPDPVFRDPNYAALALSGAVVPPPTFLIAAHHFDPQSFLRPSPGEAVPGAGVIPFAGLVATSDRPRGLHAEETFEFQRHPRIGEMLTVEVREGAVRHKEGRDSILEFKDVFWDYRDAAEALVATACWTSVFVQSRPQAAGGAAPKTSGSSAAPAAGTPPPDPTPLPARPLRAGELKAGDRWSARVVETLRMTHLVNYAGASGDLVALHYDERIVKAMGHPGLFGHGMLTMGLSGRLLTAVVGTARLRRYSARMTAVVFPGDSLTTTLVVEQLRQPDDQGNATGMLADFTLRTMNQHGHTVLSGTATAALTA